MCDSNVNNVELNNSFTDLDENILEINPVSTDSEFNEAELAKFDRWNVETLKKRDETYSQILSGYDSYVRTILKENVTRQSLFFEVSIGLLILLPIQFLILMICSIDSPNVVAILAAGAEVLVALLVFPKTIAEYLFNTNETTSINDIVTAIQHYDIEVRRGIRHTVESSNEKTTND